MKRKMVIYFSFIFLSILLSVIAIVFYYSHKLLNEKHLEKQLDLHKWVSALEFNIKDNLSLIDSLEAYLEIISDEAALELTFEDFAKALLKDHQIIRNIAIAPEGVQKYVYPFESNEIVSGHDLLNDERENVEKSLLKAVETGEIVMDGPYALRQGGYGYIGRKAIYIKGKFWGIVSAVIDMEELFSILEIFKIEDIELRITKDSGGEILFQTVDYEFKDPYYHQLHFYNDIWNIYSVPKYGFKSLVRREISIFATSLALIGVLFFTLFISLYGRKEMLNRAVEKVTHDLNENQRKLNTLFRNLPGMAFRCKNDRKWTMEIISDGGFDLTGYSADDLIQNKVISYSDVILSEDRQMVWDNIQNASDTGFYDFQYSIITRSGKRKFVIERGSHVKDSEGNTVALEGFIFDITETIEMEEKVVFALKKQKELFNNVIELVSDMLDYKDPYTVGHQKNVSELAYKIGKMMNLPDERIEILRVSGLLHDIGKTAIPTEFLTRPGNLANLEFQIIKEHPEIGFNLLNDLDFLLPIAEIVYQHHERIDGTGYPRGLKGNDILLEARIIAVADVVDAMNSNRPYRPALGLEKAVAEIRSHSGTKYDREVVEACLRVLEEYIDFEV